LVILIILFVIVLSYAKSLREQWNGYWYRKRLTALIPGDEGIPFLGNIFEVSHDSEELTRNIIERAKFARERWDGEIIKLWILHEVNIFPLTGNMLQSVLESSEEINKGKGYDVFQPFLGLGLILAGGDRWRARRKMITTSFHFTMLQGYIECMNRHAKVLVEVLHDNIGQKLDVEPFMKRFSMDVICDTAMRKDLGALHHPDQPYVEANSTLTYLGAKTTMSPHLWSAFGRWISGWQKEFDAALHIAHDFTMKVISERFDLISRGEVDVNKRAFLDMLIAEQTRSKLSIEDIREEVDTFMFAGHDTTATTLGWALWCLAHHQDIQRRAYDEVHGIFGEDLDGDCTKDDLSRMSFLERCIKETLRLFPPVPFVVRHLGNELKMGAYKIPRGASLVISPFLVHRNERLYPNPEIYDPDRFLPENSIGRHTYDYIPFSAGPRNCIGQKFAMHELKIGLSTLLRRYRFRSER
ncbi:hypothetical protein PMAYCL1PPCAC_22612, partial [Pristionchus mayeri]